MTINGIKRVMAEWLRRSILAKIREWGSIKIYFKNIINKIFINKKYINKYKKWILNLYAKKIKSLYTNRLLKKIFFK